MIEHYCQFITNWPTRDSETLVACDEPAGIKHGTAWLCAEHYDIVESGVSFWASIESRGTVGHL